MATPQLRWANTLATAADSNPRAAALLEQAFAGDQARATELTDAADRERLIQALPIFRDIMAAHERRTVRQAAG